MKKVYDYVYPKKRMISDLLLEIEEMKNREKLMETEL